ncbi:MAG: 50S ribosomal protein L29 [Labilithrix sp.]|nr:50S ribosomal protein L29 [Labilithrix sp.]
MKAKDLRERSQADLVELEKSLAKDTFTARFKNFTNRLDDTSTIRKTKRDLARVKTLLREEQLKAAAGAVSADGSKPAKPAKKAAAPKAKAASAEGAAPKAKKKSTKKASE